MTYTSGDLPPEPPGIGKFHLVFRAGLGPKPVERLLPDSKDELIALEKIITDKSKGDITRQPIWAFFGEGIDPTSRPAPAAFIHPYGASTDSYVAEIYKDVRRFHVISETFDSVFQGAAGTAFGTENVDIYLKGLLRIYLLAYDEVILTDAHVWDGKLVLQLPKIWPALCKYEQGVIAGGLKIRWEKPLGLTHARDKFYIEMKNGIPQPREVVLSLLEKKAADSFLEWAKKMNREGKCILGLDDERSAKNILVAWGKERDHYDTVNELLGTWNRFDSFIAEKTIEPIDFPNKRVWDISLQLENPARFYNSLSPQAQEILEEGFNRYRLESRRSPFH